MSHLHAWLKHKFLLRVKNFQVRLWCWIYFHMFSQFSVSTRDHTSTILSSHSKTKWCYRTQTSSLARQYLFSSSFVSSSPRILVEALLTATYLINRYTSSIFFGCFPFEVAFIKSMIIFLSDLLDAPILFFFRLMNVLSFLLMQWFVTF